MNNIINGKLDQMTIIINWVLGILLTFMLSLTFTQVVLRYVFNNPYIWADEVTLVMLIWYGYLAIALLVKEDKHISLEFLYLKFSKNIRSIFDIVRHLFILFFAILMVYFGVEMVNNAFGNKLPASSLPRPLLYIPLIISGVLIIIYSINHLITTFSRTTKGGRNKK